MAPGRTCTVLTVAAALLAVGSPAHGFGEDPGNEDPGNDENASQGGSKNRILYASATQSQIEARQVKGPAGGERGNLAATDVNWKPPVCWYEPVFTPAQLKDFAENDGSGDVGIHQSWYGEELWTDHGSPSTGEGPAAVARSSGVA